MFHIIQIQRSFIHLDVLRYCKLNEDQTEFAEKSIIDVSVISCMINT